MILSKREAFHPNAFPVAVKSRLPDYPNPPSFLYKLLYIVEFVIFLNMHEVFVSGR